MKAIEGLKVSIFGNSQDGGWLVSKTDENGIAEFGSGFCSWPWRDEKMILAVQSNEGMEWEGLVKLPTSSFLKITIDEEDR